jgi:hypothetical protein
MDCVGWVSHMFYRADVIDNGIGRLRRLIYFGGIQGRIEQGKSLEPTVCMDCVWLAMHSSRTLTANINNGLTSGKGPIADLERLNVYFWKVLKVAVYGPDADR